MSASEELLQFFTKPSCSVLQLSELRKWYQRSMRESGLSLQELLQELVDSGTVQCRTIPTTANGMSSEQCTIYWLRTDRASATPPKLGTPMSAALRERLKRSRPKFISPLLSTKRAKVAVACGESPVGKLDPPAGRLTPPVRKLDPPAGRLTPAVHVGKLDLPAGRLDFSQCSNDLSKDEALHPPEVQAKEARQQLLQERCSLERQLEERLERRRKLQMVRMYHTKNDLCQLSALTDKWRGVAQDAVEQLLVHSSLQPPPSMAQLLSYLHIDPTIIHYSPEEESFY